MPTRIKNCGLKQNREIDVAIQTGAEFIGFVHARESPRHLDLASMAALVNHARHRIKTVAVTVAPDDVLIDALLREVRPDYLQCHGIADPARIAEIGKRSGLPVMAGLSLRSAEDLALAYRMEPAAAHLLFDSPHAGSGHAFDWQLLHGAHWQKPWFLAGGLTPQNVAEAIHATGAPMVDVSSGIESDRGVKSLEKIAAFNRAVLDAGA